MEQNEDLARLEQYVEKLIDSHKRLQHENSEIQEQLQAREQEIAELQETINILQKDRGVMHNRVTGLIDRIDEWEKALDQEENATTGDPDENGKQNMSKKSSTLFNVGTEQSSESAL